MQPQTADAAIVAQYLLADVQRLTMDNAVLRAALDAESARYQALLAEFNAETPVPAAL